MDCARHGELRFEWVESGPAEIRIAFRQGNGSWSHLGTFCRQITDDDEPTMNYGWLTPDSDDVELRSVVLHEFGHALGLIHEHQNPDGEQPDRRGDRYEDERLGPTEPGGPTG